jgi:hypothetical protein
MTIQKALPRRLAGVVEQMELTQPRVVTLPELTRLALEAAAAKTEGEVPRLAYRLRSLGWLLPLRTRGAWEFSPGARAGAYGSGDRFVEFRAQLAVHPDWPGVLAMESAATLLGLAQRLPGHEVVALPKGVARPSALSDWRQVAVELPATATTVRDGLPHWTVDGLLAGIAIRPSGYQDLPGLAQWLPEAGARIDAEPLAACLTAAPASAWQRAAYLCRAAGAEQAATELLAARPPKTPVWFGATRTVGASHDPVTRVTDADLAPYLEGDLA